MIPRQIAGYRIIRKLGEGGMGIVYEAEQDRPRRRIAIKVLRPGLYGESQLRRFRLECDILGQLTHPGIAHVYDAGDANVVFTKGPSAQLPYLAMELVRGRRLLDHVNGSQLDRKARLALFADICDAVHHAHSHAVIHRDLKPSNILVDETGQPKILDFGVARVADGEPGLTQHTRTGDVIGTLQYMSPEQLFGNRALVDIRSDVYSLGVILHEMLTGTLPYGETSTSITEMIRRIEQGKVPRPSFHDPTLRGDLDAIVLSALATEVAERYPSAAALAEDIRRHLSGEPVTARGDRGWDAWRRFVRRHRRTVVVVMTFAALVVTSTIVAWVLYSQAREARLVADAARDEATERLWESYLSGASFERAAGRRGRRLNSLESLRRAAEIRPSIEVRDGVIASLALSDLALDHTVEGIRSVSAQGLENTDRIASGSAEGTTRILGLPNGDELLRLQGPPKQVYMQRFSPDGRYLAVKYHPRVYAQSEVAFWTWDLSSGKPILKLEAGELVGTAVAYGTSTSAGRWIAVGQTDGRAHLYRLDTGDPWKTLGSATDVIRVAVNHDGDELAIASGSGQLSIWNVEAGTRTFLADLPTRASGIIWMPNGNFVIGSLDGDLYVWDPRTRETQRALIGHQGYITRLELSTDGNVLASSAWDSTIRLWDLRFGREIIAPLLHEVLVGFGNRLVTENEMEARIYTYVPSRECRVIGTNTPFTSPASAHVHSNGRLLTTTANYVGVQIWDLERGELLHTVEGQRYRWAAFLENGNDALLAFQNDSLLSWPLRITGQDVSLGKPEALWTGRSHNGTAFLQTSSNVVLVTSPAEIVLIDPTTKRRSLSMPGYTGIAEPSLSPDRRWAFTGRWRQGTARVWDLEKRAVVAQFSSGPNIRGRFSPDSRALLVCDGPTLTCYDVGSWRVLYRIDDTGLGRGGAYRPSFSPDGRMVALPGGGGYDVRLYDIDTGVRLATLTPPELVFVSVICFTPSGDALVALMQGRVMQIWDLREIRRQLREKGLDW
jgi:WD40 repeat protein